LQIINLSFETTEEALLKALEERFEEKNIRKVTIIKNHQTGRSRGYGFVAFKDKKTLEEALFKSKGLEI
jgi:RNA recognition motif-containing protein